ncbi:hypothetical protein DPMN_150667 [Dreissena polymorpha]|uniref:SSD domain-containing protein n=1 Tax=Dreissena polymorpha TaxID=45954 RepID=A0A9D4J6J4_DREPO|nr:hypothetical protein DPMN_150667 [Dreissena polymorpha]
MDNPAFTDVTNYSASNGISNGTSDGTSGTGHKEANGSLPHTKAKSRLNCLARARNKLICSLEMIFYRVGKVIAHHPVLTIILAVIPPLLLSIGIIKFQFNTDFAELLLPPSSRIFEDRAWVRSHVTYEQRVIRLILKNDNVLSKESLVGLYHLHEEILSLTAKDNHTMESMCVRLLNKCFVDSLLALWKNDLSVIETLTDQSIIDTINTVKFNPTYLFAFNASRILGLMERNSSGHIVSAGVMHADWLIQSSEQLHRRAKELEYAAINIVRFGNHPVFHRVNIFTVDSYGEEFFGGVYGDTILIVYWFPVVALYIVMALGKLNLLEHGVYLAIGAILGVALSTGACFGIGMAAGFLFGAPHQALVFLLLAVGVDDAFVILTTWERVNKRHLHKPIEERVALTMQHAGVSVTVTSFTNLVAFASGVTTQMPVLQSFCVYCSFGILFCFLMQSTVFPACLTLERAPRGGAP